MNERENYTLIKLKGLDDFGVMAIEDTISGLLRGGARVEWGGVSCRVMLYDADREARSLTLLLYDEQSHSRHAEIKLADEAAELLRCYFDIEVTELTKEELMKKRPDLERKMMTVCCARSIRYDEVSAAFSLKSAETVLEEAANACGWSDFHDALVRIGRLIDNDKSMRARRNVAFVVSDSGVVDGYIRALYDFYLAKQVITTPLIYRGDLEDAARSLTDGGYMYVVEDAFSSYEDCMVFGESDESESLRTLCAKKGILVAKIRKKDYEKVAANPLFECLFPTVVEIAEPTAAEKLAFIKKEAAAYNFAIAADVDEKTMKGADLEKVSAKLVKAITSKLSEESCGYTLSADDFRDEREEGGKEPLSPLSELDALAGLENVKRTVREIAAFVKRCGAQSGICLHMVFRGRPGTGKTTVARIIGKIFGELGVVKNPERFVEADRNSLVSKYLGGTASRTKDAVTAALGGVLFIDEAYALCAGNDYDYGREAVAMLVKLMEDHRDEFVCILAGYSDEMDEMLDMNPGMRGRVQFYIDFPDYSVDEMMEIFASMCRAEGYTASAGAEALLEDFFERLSREDDFANGRTVRRVFEQLRLKQAARSDQNEINEDDVKAVIDSTPLGKSPARIRKIGFLGAA